MALHDHLQGQTYDPNPSNDENRNSVYGLVIDVNDPTQRGRVQVQILGEQNNITNLPWVHCEYNNEPQIRGVGSFPSKYLVGSKILVERHGDNMVVRGAVPNTEKDGRKDINTGATGASPIPNLLALIKGGMPPRFDAMLKKFGVKSHWQLKGIKHATDINKNPLDFSSYIGDSIKSTFENGFSPKSLGKIPGHLNLPTITKIASMGPIKFDASPNGAKSALNALGNAGNFVSKALEMAQSMQSFAEKGQPVNAMEIIGGVQNFKSAIASIASLLSSHSSQMGTEKEKDDLDELLYQIYFEETGLQALDERGKETREFKVWRKLYAERQEEAIS